MVGNRRTRCKWMELERREGRRPGLCSREEAATSPRLVYAAAVIRVVGGRGYLPSEKGYLSGVYEWEKGLLNQVCKKRVTYQVSEKRVT